MSWTSVKTVRFTVNKDFADKIRPVCSHYSNVFRGPPIHDTFTYTIFNNGADHIDLIMTGQESVIQAVLSMLAGVTKQEWTMEKAGQS